MPIISSPPPNNRVLKSGDTMTGKLTVSNSGGNNAIDITSSGGPSIVQDTSAGNGISIRGTDGSRAGKLRIVANGNAWADVQASAYFQIDTTDDSHNITFQSGDYGSDTQFSRLQFASLHTSFTDESYFATPVPTALVEVVGTTSTKVGIKVISGSASTANFQEWQNSIGTVLCSIDSGGNLSLGLGQKLKITAGSNASIGVGTLSAGSITVSTSAVTSNSLVFLTDTASSLTNVGNHAVTSISAGTSFTVQSSNTLDTSTFNWLIIN